MDEGTNYKVKDIGLAKEGRLKIELAEKNMPVLMALRKQNKGKKPLRGIRISGCLHVTKETAVLVETLRDLGAVVSWSGCNPLSTQDDVAAALAAAGIQVFAWRGLSRDEYYWCIEKCLQIKPNITVDDGADLVLYVHDKKQEYLAGIIGGCEETTTGILRLKAMEAAGRLKYPMMSVSEAKTKADFDNIWGTGQSTIDGILRATNTMFAGKTVVVAGYGHVGSGIAERARGMGGNVIVTEVDPLPALKARMNGFRVMKMADAAKEGDLFITATGCCGVVTVEHAKSMKDGAILCNSGHFNVEVDVAAIEKASSRKRQIRPNMVEYLLGGKKRVSVLAEGRLVNLAAAEGHPSEVMDMSFANQLLAILWLVRAKNSKKALEPKVYAVPEEQDSLVARMKLAGLGASIDKLSKEQLDYLSGYDEGT
ncbi:MAG: adenosylhomocysteinase [archaeon]